MKSILIGLSIFFLISTTYGYSLNQEFENEDNEMAAILPSGNIQNSVENHCKCLKFPRPVDCEEVLENGNTVSGVYTIYPRSRTLKCESLQVYCDMDTDGGGWTVIQRRGDFGNGENFFFKNWQSYKDGFGNLEKEFWLGNDNIFHITNQGSYSARFDLRHHSTRSAFALYDTFWIDDEAQNYMLHIQEYSGDAGDSFSTHNKRPFYTKDRPNIPPNAKLEKRHSAGWWFNVFPSTNLNGLNKKDPKTYGARDGITWLTFGGYVNSLQATEIKVRSKKFN